MEIFPYLIDRVKRVRDDSDINLNISECENVSKIKQKATSVLPKIQFHAFNIFLPQYCSDRDKFWFLRILFILSPICKILSNIWIFGINLVES